MSEANMDKENIHELDISEVDKIIQNQINEYVNKYNKYPKYIKIPLWISYCMKKKMKEIEHYNLEYNTELLMYRDLIVCETITISELKEIEVF